MRKFLLPSLFLVAGCSVFATALPQAHAQTLEDEIEDSDIVAETLSEDEGLPPEEAPPKPEPPYPGSDEEGFARSAPRPTPTPAPLTKERPKQITDEGHYLYGTDLKPVKPSGRPGVGQPLKTNEGGEYFYGDKTQPDTFSKRPGVPPPLSTDAKGEFHYPTESSPMTASASFRFGFFSPPDIKNADTNVTFEQLYGDSNIPSVLGDYEWRLTSKVGRLGIKFGSGVFFSTGHGRFKEPRPNGITEAREKYTFLMFPNQLTASYRFQYAENQVLVPYVEGGAGYFTFAEIRDDGQKPKFGGAATTVVAGGLNLLLDWMDRKSIRQLDNDYGINHVWLTLEYKQIVGLNKDIDFSSRLLNAGFMMEF